MTPEQRCSMNAESMKILTTFGGSLIVRHMQNPQVTNGDVWHTRSLGPIDFPIVHGNNLGYYCSMRQIYTGGDNAYYFYFGPAGFIDCFLFNMGYQSYESRRGSHGSLGEWMNAVIFPLVFDKCLDSTLGAWKAAH
jgi:hypothetical protein